MGGPFLIAETPNAGSRGHRFLVSSEAPASDGAISTYVRSSRASDETEGEGYVAVRRKVKQRCTGRPGAEEILVLVGVDASQFREDARKELFEKLHSLLPGIDDIAGGIDWSLETRLVVPSEGLTAWIRDHLAPWLTQPTAQKPKSAGRGQDGHASGSFRGRKWLLVVASITVLVSLVGIALYGYLTYRDQANEQHLQAVKETLATEDGVNALQDLLQRLERIPYPRALSSGQRARQDELRSSIEQKIVHRQDERFLAEVRMHLANGDFRKAVAHARKRRDEDKLHREACREIATFLNAAARKVAQQKFDDLGYGAARRAIDQQFGFPELAALLGPNALEGIRDWLDEKEDRRLYERIGKGGTYTLAERLEDYLKSEVKKSNKRMARPVEELQSYLRIQHEPAEVRLMLAIRWGEGQKGKSSLELTVEVAGKPVSSPLAAEPGKSIQEIHFKARPQERMKLVLHIHQTGRKQMKPNRLCTDEVEIRNLLDKGARELELKKERNLLERVTGKSPQYSIVEVKMVRVKPLPQLPRYDASAPGAVPNR
jgi:hypothetical protein